MDDAPIVKDTRRIRCENSRRFGNSVVKYVDSLREPERGAKPTASPAADAQERSWHPKSESIAGR